MNVRVEIKTNDTVRDMRRLKAAMPKFHARGLTAAGQYLVGQVQKNKLQGQALNRDSSRLIGSIDFDIVKRGLDQILYIGSNAKSKKGFNYPKYWEMEATRVPPRPYLEPTIRERNFRARTLFKKQIIRDVNNMFPRGAA